MDYQSAREVGDVAEAMVADSIAGLQRQYGFFAFHDALIAKQTPSGPITAQLDHLIVDQYGLLVIETKARNGALIRGTYADKNWTACYPGGSNKTFQNPLRQNEQHLNLMHQVLKDDGWPLALDQIRGLVVFVNADISQLELDSVTQLRVADLARLGERYALRHDFAPYHPLQPEDVAQLAAAVAGLNRSRDPYVVAAHQKSREGYSGARSGKSGAGSSASHNGAATHSAPRASAGTEPSLTPLRVAVLLTLALIALGFLWWAVTGLINGTAPAWVWIVLIVLLGALGGEGKKGGRRRRRNRGGTSSSAGRPPFVVRLVLAMVLLGFGFAFLAALPSLAERWVSGLTGASQSAAGSSVTGTAPREPDVALALKRLQEADPSLRQALVNPELPDVERLPDGRVTYRWAYWDRTTSASDQIRETSITLDRNGMITGAGQ